MGGMGVGVVTVINVLHSVHEVYGKGYLYSQCCVMRQSVLAHCAEDRESCLWQQILLPTIIHGVNCPGSQRPTRDFQQSSALQTTHAHTHAHTHTHTEINVLLSPTDWKHKMPTSIPQGRANCIKVRSSFFYKYILYILVMNPFIRPL